LLRDIRYDGLLLHDQQNVLFESGAYATTRPRDEVAADEGGGGEAGGLSGCTRCKRHNYEV
jgi:hypothetical protein